MPTTDADPVLTIDTKYGGPYAGSSIEVSEAAAAHFNAAAANASGVLPGEYVPFAAGEYFSIACPTVEMDRHDFIAAYQQLRAVIDGEVEIVLSEHPRLYSTGLHDPSVIRGVPTYIPKARMADGFFGRSHQLEVFQGDQRIAGPGERFFHSATSGVVFDQIEDAHGRLIVEMRGDLARLATRGEVVFFTDPAFGEPTGVELVGADGTAETIAWIRWAGTGSATPRYSSSGSPSGSGRPGAPRRSRSISRRPPRASRSRSIRATPVTRRSASMPPSFPGRGE